MWPLSDPLDRFVGAPAPLRTVKIARAPLPLLAARNIRDIPWAVHAMQLSKHYEPQIVGIRKQKAGQESIRLSLPNGHVT